MKTCIYVFSGTGTTLAAAQKLADHVGDTDVKLIPQLLARSQGEPISTDASAIGLAFPNYFGGVPQIVLEFIQRLDLSGADYIFSVVTGGGGRGRCFGQLQQALAAKGKPLDYGKSIIGMSNYIVGWYYQLISKIDTQRDEALRHVEQKAIDIAADISSQRREIEKDQPFSYYVSRLLSSKDMVQDTRGWDKDFSIGDSCTGCGICAKVCQVQNISIKGRQPVFEHNCQRCMACIQYCPAKAIYYKGKPLDKPRYTHPDYPADVMIKRIHKDDSGF